MTVHFNHSPAAPFAQFAGLLAEAVTVHCHGNLSSIMMWNVIAVVTNYLTVAAYL